MIRRLVAADCTRLRAYLAAAFAADPALAAYTPATAEDLADNLATGALTWLSLQRSTITGVLGPTAHGVREVRHDPPVVRSFVFFGRLLADSPLIQRDLTLFAAADLRAAGLAPDDVLIAGPPTCAGAAWCRAMNLTETDGPLGKEWIVPFDEIPDRAAAAVTPT